LVERKGFHRVLACMPELLQKFPALHYLVVGSPGPEGDYSEQLKRQVAELRLGERVHFLGGMPPERLCDALSAADVFVLATRNEGWANVLLEAMACGLPVVATDVGGNAQVVCQRELGTIVPFGDHAALTNALSEALMRNWDRATIRRYAEDNDWQKRVAVLLEEFRALHARTVGSSA
jgi:glycosyltransferase involved in cell wall biosynthesis